MLTKVSGPRNNPNKLMLEGILYTSEDLKESVDRITAEILVDEELALVARKSTNWENFLAGEVCKRFFPIFQTYMDMQAYPNAFEAVVWVRIIGDTVREKMKTATFYM